MEQFAIAKKVVAPLETISKAVNHNAIFEDQPCMNQLTNFAMFPKSIVVLFRYEFEFAVEVNAEFGLCHIWLYHQARFVSSLGNQAPVPITFVFRVLIVFVSLTKNEFMDLNFNG